MRCAFGLFAQVNPLDLGRNFRAAEQQFHWANAVLTVAILAAVGAVAWWTIRYMTDGERRGYRSPRGMFRELCRAHDLDRPSRALLTRLAAAQRLAPAVLFLKPESFDVAQLSGDWQSERSRLEQLRDRIFGRQLNDISAA